MAEPVIPAASAARLAALPADPDLPGGPDGAAWLARVPRLLAERLAAWSLTPDGSADGGAPRVLGTALVFPVRRHTLRPASLVLTWPHAAARQEHLALRLWDGAGAARLHAADPRAHAVLLERLETDRPLRAEPILDACETVGALLRTLDRPATAQFDTLAARRDPWLESLARPHPAVPRRLLVQARSHLADLLDSAPAPRLVHADLHDGVVLAPPPDAGRPDWLTATARPVAGEAAYAVGPQVWHRAALTARAHRPRVHARIRADVVADAAGLDPERVRAWTFVRLVLRALEAAGRGASADAERTHLIALAGAFAS